MQWSGCQCCQSHCKQCYGKNAKTESTASSGSAKTDDTQAEKTGKVYGPYGTKAKTESTASSSSAKTEDTQVENTDKVYGPYGTKAKEFQRNKESRQKCKAFDERQAAWRHQHPLQAKKWEAKVAIAKKAIAERKAKQTN